MPYQPADEIFEPPADRNASIWRYMDFTKFVWMLEGKALWFSRADLLGDVFEGSYPRMNVMAMRALYREHGLPEMAAKSVERSNEQIRRWTFINSWHMNEHESAAMWSLYLKSDEGFAVKSTFRRLCDSLAAAQQRVAIGLVRYLDYDQEMISPGNISWPFVRKRLSFEHEREVRALVHDFEVAQSVIRSEEACDLEKALDPTLHEPPPAGLEIPVSLDVLIDRIYIAPTAPTWFAELVEAIARKYELGKEVSQSALGREPIY